uniref:C2H2-type domain-containing protein n=1 Tax=uncultured marine microorganism HF4000_ANIW141A21 TaxID=455535 RepID=B3T5A5_9ZZZZ|nr:hypothetical protein ALOHA_HF4000ANIW141A21ctg1g49 [uncultured marine microorganism HF4000_ANIW141A21]
MSQNHTAITCFDCNHVFDSLTKYLNHVDRTSDEYCGVRNMMANP